MLLTATEILLPLRQPDGTTTRSRWPNLGLTALYFALSSVLNLLFVGYHVAMAGALQVPFGLMNLALPYVAVVVIGLLLLDFFAYLAHAVMHHVPWFWRFHRVHHSDVFVDASTAFRQHPMEGILRYAFAMIPAVVLGIPLEVFALYRMLGGINAVFEHANFRYPDWVDTIFSTVFVTPNIHKVHHSHRRHETDSNYGNLFSIFDRAFRTFIPAWRAKEVTYGLDSMAERGREGVGGLLAMPFRP